MDGLKHYGTPRRSGRYPWGSGKDPHQHNKSFLGYVEDLRSQGLNDTEIAKGLGMTRNQLQAKRSIAIAEQREADAALALRLKEKGYTTSAIARRMGKNESSVRSLLDPALREKANITAATSLTLKDAVDNKGFIDIGAGVEQHLGVSRTKLNTAVAMLEEQGYTTHYVKVEQLGTGKFTTIKVLAPPDTPYSEVYKNRYGIKLVEEYSEDGGRTFRGIEPPQSVSSDRILIRYKEDGGADKDGVIEVRRGVDDLSLGDSAYAQVRVTVDGKHYMKGMAMYSDKIPDGYDVIYNVSKPKGTPSDKVFKTMEDDPDNPFGSTIRQKHYIDKNGNERLSALNMVGYKEGGGEEGSWDTWSKNISSQILSKQTPALAKKQLGLVLKLKEEEFDEIMKLTNPAVKKALLETFSDSADSAAVHLKAAHLPRQNTHVILPIKSMKEGEVYAPNYRQGENVVLLRHPHGGVFEIPELRVNNKNPEARSLLGNALDAIGIHPKVAGKLSGADFDGDTVIVIPNKNRSIKTAASLKGLQNFDPITAYPGYKDMKRISVPQKDLKMGDVSNLITDMTIKGANFDEIARAVRHSMVVIDSEKHGLNYKQSYLDNNIAGLKEKYQGGKTSGASTLISRAGAEVRVRLRKEGQFLTDPKTGKTKRVYIDPKTGKRLYEETGETYVDRKGKVVYRTTKSKRAAEVDDLHSLSSGTAIESIYADHGNALKRLANKARLSMINVDKTSYSRSARETYAKSVATLNSKLSLAFRNKPLERQAQLLANKIVSAKRKANPGMSPSDLKKLKGQALEEARARYKAKKQEIEITDREWEAIQAGAISNNTLSNILKNTDMAKLKERAMPRYTSGMSPARVSRARAMLALGYTSSEVADALGVSVSTVNSAVNK